MRLSISFRLEVRAVQINISGIKIGKEMVKKILKTTEPRLPSKALRKHAKKYASYHRCSGGAHQILAIILLIIFVIF